MSEKDEKGLFAGAIVNAGKTRSSFLYIRLHVAHRRFKLLEFYH
jgi:hypothetical protein